MLNLFNLRGRLSWKLGANGEEKVNGNSFPNGNLLVKLSFSVFRKLKHCSLQVVLSAVEVESLRSEIADLEERESHFKAQ